MHTALLGKTASYSAQIRRGHRLAIYRNPWGQFHCFYSFLTQILQALYAKIKAVVLCKCCASCSFIDNCDADAIIVRHLSCQPPSCFCFAFLPSAMGSFAPRLSSLLTAGRTSRWHNNCTHDCCCRSCAATQQHPLLVTRITCRLNCDRRCARRHGKNF